MSRDRVPPTVIILAAIGLGVSVAAQTLGSRAITGRVRSAGSPIGGATVRVYGTDRAVTSAADGSFVLPVDGPGDVLITAAKPGYYNLRRNVRPDTPVQLDLTAIPASDNATYAWQDPSPNPKRPDNCGNCHSAIYRQWSGDAHARAAINPIVLDMYNGTGAHGATDIVPGYRLDWSDDGNCAGCHAPLASAQHPGISLNDVTGVAKGGVSCDFCHKVREVSRNTQFPNIEDVRVLRPPAGRKLLFGPFDDAIFPKDVPDFSFAPVFSSSQFCAGCHEGAFWGTPVYETFSEWRESPYAKNGVQCQQCHMRPVREMSRMANAKDGGIVRPSDRLRSHMTMGEARDDMVRGAARLTTTASARGAVLDVTVRIANVGAGHDLPTGQPMRNLILLVTPVDAEGRALRLVAGERVPVWGGDFASHPGTGFAKILATVSEYARAPQPRDQDSEQANYPAPFWRRTKIVSDNRIRAKSEVTEIYSFDLSEAVGPVTVNTRLIYRRAFQPLARLKGWDLPDVELAADHVRVTVVESGAR